MRSAAKRMRGFALVSAIFILVVLAALGAFIVNISTSQHIGSALDVQGVRAYHAARAGIEWGVYQVQSTAAYNFSYGTPPTTVGAANPNLRSCATANGSLAVFNMTVTVTCLANDDGVNGGPTVYTVTSTACSDTTCPNITNPGPLYIERRIEVVF